MKLASAVIALESWLQEELAAQGRLARLLERQEAAIREGDDPALELASSELEAELASQPRRAQKRSLLLSDLASRWGLPAGSMKLSEISSRAADDGVPTDRLEKLRGEVRAAAAAVLRRGRRVATLARYHQSLVGELMTVLFEDGSEKGSDQPRLVDAQA